MILTLPVVEVRAATRSRGAKAVLAISLGMTAASGVLIAVPDHHPTVRERPKKQQSEPRARYLVMGLFCVVR